ncbi:MAG: hypothetical protein PUC36_00165 [Clostridiales bacterium]|nr:hypothetical protein [Clostridiales bacterium]
MDTCPKCGGRTDYSRTYDAFFCPKCDAWLEETCEDPNCKFCAGRPLRPSLAPDR